MIPLNKTNLGLIAASIWLCTFSSQFLAQETQSITLNRAALLNAYELISEGRVILDKKALGNKTNRQPRRKMNSSGFADLKNTVSGIWGSTVATNSAAKRITNFRLAISKHCIAAACSQ